jgi:hypothetical protein
MYKLADKHLLMMRKINFLLLAFILLGTLQIIGCKKKNDPLSPNELIQKSWVAKEVKENGSKVFDSGMPTHTVNYSKFKLEFLNATDVRLTELDGTVATGKWSLNGPALSLTQLTPEPTSTGGKIDYSSVSVTATELKITRSGTNAKTGQSNTEYVLR